MSQDPAQPLPLDELRKLYSDPSKVVYNKTVLDLIDRVKAAEKKWERSEKKAWDKDQGWAIAQQENQALRTALERYMHTDDCACDDGGIAVAGPCLYCVAKKALAHPRGGGEGT